MAILKFDFSDLEQMKRFPAHGWAANSQGVKILWCPLPHRTFDALLEKSISDCSYRGIYLDTLPFADELRKLVIVLRQLHEATGAICDHPCTLGNEEALSTEMKLRELVPLYIDLAFIYLRRIPDRLALACRPLLFKHWKSVPTHFRNWISMADQLDRYMPSCNLDFLRETLVHDTEWFQGLRATSPVTGRKGTRDALEHRGVRQIIMKQQAGDKRPTITVMLESRSPDVEIRNDLLPQVHNCVAGLCRLMACVQRSLGLGCSYEFRDHLISDGTDDDMVGFWPKISA